MRNLWNKKIANEYIKKYKKLKISKDLALRIYTTHLLGAEKKLVLHGGGNTSLKEIRKDIFNKIINVMHVKGSGWDMSNLTEEGMPTVFLDPLIKTLEFKKLSDKNMVNFLRNNLLNPSSPNPSVETLLHAFLPHKYIDHTHSSAILSLVNLENSNIILKKIFGKKLAIVPYVMPGFDLAKICYQYYKRDEKVEGLLLLNHGIFTFAETAEDSYKRMIKYVTKAENYIKKCKLYSKKINIFNKKNYRIDVGRFQNNIRKIYYKNTNEKWIIKYNGKKEDILFSNLKNLKTMFSKGPVTPDHVIRIKSSPLIIDTINNITDGFIERSIIKYQNEYKKYFQKYQNTIKNSKISDPLPRIIILPNIGYFSIGLTQKEEKISNDIFISMKDSIIDANHVSTFKSINKKEIFKMEYWPLERAKLNSKKRKKFEGNIAIITGGAGKIGSAVAKKFLDEDIEVVLLDKNFANIEDVIKNKCTCIKCDLSDNEEVKKSINKVVSQFGGIDILISNSGSAFQGQMQDLDEKVLRDSMSNNFYSHHYIIQETVKVMIRQSFGGSISINLSKQSINPGNNFGPYGIAKASSLFMMKQYALECGKFNIRVNGINADRIQSGLLTKKIINQRAKARGIKESEYLKNNLLNKEVTASDVAESFFVQLLLDKTTANIITVDGGNIEASLR
jgi:rhamnose utilization protein RhaD (predicted bifunctional aldolase and dehydrogenase)/NAD(P)-dependent dehydrogenase (short-subunit alcohol dehydrogenase family)